MMPRKPLGSGRCRGQSYCGTAGCDPERMVTDPGSLWSIGTKAVRRHHFAGPPSGMTSLGCLLPPYQSKRDLFEKAIRAFPDHVLVDIQGRPQGLIGQQIIEIGDRMNKTVLELRPRSPREFFVGEGNVRTPLARVVLRKWLVDDFGG